MSVLVLKENGNSLEDSFSRIFRKFNFIPKGRIFLKPNFSARPPIIPGENTDPVFLEKLIKFLLKKGATEIIVGHGVLLGTVDKKFFFDEMIKKGGFSFLKNMKGVTLLNIDEQKKEVIEYAGIKFSFPDILKKVDSYINIAKIKAHMETDLSLSLKNQMGLVSMMDRVNIHKNNLNDYIAYISKMVRPNLSIIDGVTAMEGNGPHNGKSRKLNLLISGDDMVELDSVTAFLLDYNFKKILHIVTAEKIGVGKYPAKSYLDSIGNRKVKNFKKAEKYEKFLKNIYVWPTKGCSRCITALNEYGFSVKKNPLKNLKLLKKAILGNKKINIIIGRADDFQIPENEKNICIGFCTRNFSSKNNLKNLDKCPPSVKEVIEYINNELDS